MNWLPLPANLSPSRMQWAGLVLAGVLISALAPAAALTWLGAALASLPLIFPHRTGAAPLRGGRMLGLVSLTMLAAGLAAIARHPELSGSIRSTGAILALGGLGGLAGWIPFRGLLAARPLDPQPEHMTAVQPLVDLAPPLMGLVVAGRLCASEFGAWPQTATSVVYLSAVLTMVVAALRLPRDHTPTNLLALLSGMGLCGISADLPLHDAVSLSIAAPEGRLAGLLVWLHGCAGLLLGARLSESPQRIRTQEPEAARKFAGRARRRRIGLVIADWELAGAPPGPGFWLRAQLLLALVSRQHKSNITEEFEPHFGLLTLAAILTMTWSALMAKRLGRALGIPPPDNDHPA